MISKEQIAFIFKDIKEINLIINGKVKYISFLMNI